MFDVTCRACGLVFGHRPDGKCPACGAPVEAASPAPHAGPAVEDSRDGYFATTVTDMPVLPTAVPEAGPSPTALFHRRLREITPHAFVTNTIVAANVVVFAVMLLNGVEILSPTGEQLIAWGANFGPRTLAGEWWRLLACTFLHIGIIHLLLNMWILWGMGHLVERLVGNVGFLVLYLVSGLAGSLTSVFWNSFVISAGASGAVFGVFGALMGFLLFRRDSVPAHVLAGLRNSGLSFLFYNLIFGLSVSGIDMAAHVGGLVAGFVCGVLLSQSLDRVTGLRRAVRNLIVVAVGAAGIAAAIDLAPPAPIDLDAELERFTKVENEALKSFNQAVEESRAGRLSDAQFAEVLDARVLPPWRSVRERFESLEMEPLPAAQKTLATKLLKYMQVREDAWRKFERGLRDQDMAVLEEFRRLNDEAESLVRDLNAVPPK